MNKKQLVESLKKQKFPEKIIDAFRKVKREDFIPKNLKNLAYEDNALQLEEGATISQPYTIAFMLSLLELKENQKILEIGSGSGYVLALILKITKKGEIYGIEIIKSLAEKSQSLFLKDRKITVLNKDGSNGLLESAPFDRILISAASNNIPYHLTNQLKYEGIIVAPVKNSIFQIKKYGDKITTNEYEGFIFVPLQHEK